MSTPCSSAPVAAAKQEKAAKITSGQANTKTTVIKKVAMQLGLVMLRVCYMYS
jgi:hypothetical protein